MGTRCSQIGVWSSVEGSGENKSGAHRNTPLIGKTVQWTGESLSHEVDAPGAFDLTGDFPVEPHGDAGEAAGEDFAGLSGEFREIIRLFVVDHFHLDVITAARHALVMLAEIDEALRGLGLHGG